MDSKLKVPDDGDRLLESIVSLTHGDIETSKNECQIDKEIQIIITGASGSGKSTAGNILLGQECFPLSGQCIGTAVQGENETQGRLLKVLDTPDISSLELADNIKANEEITEWKRLCPQPHMILLTVRCDQADGDADVSQFRTFKRLWGEDIRRRLVVLFTFGDKLQEGIDELMTRPLPGLQEILSEAGHRYVIFDKTLSASEQVERSGQVFTVLHDLRHECNVMIIGKTGSGKSTLGNLLLNTVAFPVASGMAPVNKPVMKNTTTIGGVTVNVVDTPDVSNLDINEEPAEEEIKKWYSCHVDVILLAVRCDARYTAEQHQTYKHIKETLGELFFCSKLTVAFTFGDRLHGGIEKELEKTCTDLQQVLKDAGGRYKVFSQDDKEEEKNNHLISLLTCVPNLETSIPAATKKSKTVTKESSHYPDIPPNAIPVLSSEDMDERLGEGETEFRIIIIGASGSGKSTAASVLLGEYQLPASSDSDPLSPPKPKCQLKESKTPKGRLKVLDTPDISSMELADDNKANEQMTEWKRLCSQPHLILLTVRCDQADGDADVSQFRTFKRLWGEDIRRRLVVLFTFGDKLQEGIDKLMTRPLPGLQEILSEAGHRYVIFDKTLSASEQVERSGQVLRVLHDLKHGFKVIIIGKTGNGKSTLGNSLLGKKLFPISRGMASSTTRVMKATTTDKYGVTITVMDTPDVSNLDIDQKAGEEEIKKWHSFHADIILLAVRCDVRYTAEEYQIYRQIQEVLGKQYVCSRLMMAFTFGDLQDSDITEELKTVCIELQQVLEDAGGRYVLFSQDDQENKKDERTRFLMGFVPNLEIPCDVKGQILAHQSAKPSKCEPLTGNAVYGVIPREYRTTAHLTKDGDLQTTGSGCNFAQNEVTKPACLLS